MDLASHPGRTKTGESVQSRYPLQVGEIDALVISDGTMSIPASVLAVNVPSSELEAWLDGMFLPPRFGWPVNVGVVRSGGAGSASGGLGRGRPGPSSKRSGVV